jgi:alpha/beta superfamily hydrolase
VTPDIATWRDAAAGIVEEAAFFGPQGGRALGVRHLPESGTARAGVVVLSPLKAEYMKNYRHEVVLARELAKRGFAVQRLNYRGTGHSDGVSADITFETLVEDARAVERELRERTGVEDVAFLGTRLGGLVAAAVGGTDAPLVLWEPVAEAGSYFREIFRSRLMSDMRLAKQRQAAATGRPSTQALMDEMTRTGAVDVLGYSIDRGLYESTKDRTLAAELAARPRRVLLVQCSRSQELRGAYAPAKERVEAAGREFQTVIIPAQVAWQFQDTEASRDTWVEPAVAATAEWLANTFAGVAA